MGATGRETLLHKRGCHNLISYLFHFVTNKYKKSFPRPGRVSGINGDHDYHHLGWYAVLVPCPVETVDGR